AIKKLLYFAMGGMFIAAVVVTFSRGGFLGLMVALLVLARKMGRKNKFLSTGALVVAISAVLIFAPGSYFGRISSIMNSAADFTGSSSQRTEILKRSFWVTLRYPLFGVGMGNFHFKSVQELVTHNAYTQVSSEMGIPALVIYLMFMIYPLRKLRRIEAETFDDPERRRFHYWSIGVQASIIAYMVASFFASVAYYWYIYYLIGYAVAVRRLYYVEQVKNAQ
ncbi:MAG TPA: O-antigen ligase family protein, partial [Pyrinomonadaceae bacterium]|nr:O-antigen ligase family protein [Pyrinomonadaceae bacterium]